MKIVNMVNVSLLSNEMQIKLAEEYGLSDASQHMLAQTEDGKFFLFKDVRCTSVTPAGAENDPKEVTYTIKNETYSTVRRICLTQIASMNYHFALLYYIKAIKIIVVIIQLHLDPATIFFLC